jgi:hypothetical protein
VLTFEEFGKGECVRISTRRDSYFQYRDDKGKFKTKKIKANTTLEVQTNFIVKDKAWVHLRNYGWCLVPIKDWKITKNIHPRYHAHCLEYQEEREKWLNQQPSKINSEGFEYVCLTKEGRD